MPKYCLFWLMHTFETLFSTAFYIPFLPFTFSLLHFVYQLLLSARYYWYPLRPMRGYLWIPGTWGSKDTWEPKGTWEFPRILENICIYWRSVFTFYANILWDKTMMYNNRMINGKEKKLSIPRENSPQILRYPLDIRNKRIYTYFLALIIIISLVTSFSHQLMLVIFHWSLNDSNPGLFWVFLLILTMLWFGWSWFFLWFPILPSFFPNLWGPFQVHQLQLVSLSTSCFTFFFFSFPARSKCLSIFSLSFTFTLWSTKAKKSTRS